MPEPKPGALIPLFMLKIPGSDDPPALSLHPSPGADPGQLILGCGDGHLRAYDLITPGAPSLLWTSPRSHKEWITDIAVVPNRGLVVSADRQGRLWCWSLEDGRRLGEFRGHGAWVFSLAASPDGTRVASVGDDGQLHIWRMGSPEPVLSVPFAQVGALDASPASALGEGRPAGLYAVAWSPDGALLAVGDFDGYITLLEAWSGRVQWRRKGVDDIPWSLAFSPKGTHIALGTGASGAGVMSVEGGALARLSALGAGATPGVAWLGGGAVVSGGEAGILGVQGLGGETLGRGEFPEGSLWRLGVHQRAGCVFSAHPGGVVRGWRWKDTTPLLEGGMSLGDAGP